MHFWRDAEHTRSGAGRFCSGGDHSRTGAEHSRSGAKRSCSGADHSKTEAEHSYSMADTTGVMTSYPEVVPSTATRVPSTLGAMPSTPAEQGTPSMPIEFASPPSDITEFMDAFHEGEEVRFHRLDDIIGGTGSSGLVG